MWSITPILAYAVWTTWATIVYLADVAGPKSVHHRRTHAVSQKAVHSAVPMGIAVMTCGVMRKCAPSR